MDIVKFFMLMLNSSVVDHGVVYVLCVTSVVEIGEKTLHEKICK